MTQFGGSNSEVDCRWAEPLGEATLSSNLTMKAPRPQVMLRSDTTILRSLVYPEGSVMDWMRPVGLALAVAVVGVVSSPAWAADDPKAQAAALRKQNIVRLATESATTEAALRLAIGKPSDVEPALAAHYEKVLLLCKEKFDDLEQDRIRYESAEARTRVLGNLTALFGSVATYAPGKTVLVGLGLASGNSGSVSSTLTQFFSDKSAADEATLTALKAQLTVVLDRFDDIAPKDDDKGVRRRNVLARARGICMGLTPISAPTPVASGASAPSTGASAPQ